MRSVPVVFLGLWAGCMVPAVSAAAEPAPVEIEAAAVADVVVTARKRPELSSDVPISLAVIPGEALADRGVREVSQLQTVTPGLTFVGSNTPRGAGVSIRGVATVSFSEGVEGSVGVVLDGVPIGRQGAGFTNFADLERVEVLRGPQGTLFGKNASAGVIALVTKGPTATVQAGGGLTAGGSGERHADAFVSGPLNDRIRARLSGYADQRDGDIRDVAQARDYNGRDEYGLRGKIEFDLTPSSRLLVSADYTARDAACCMWTTRSVGDPIGPVARYQAAFGITPGPENRQVALDGDIFGRQRTRGLSAELTAALPGGLTLTSISAVRAWNEIDNSDLDQTPINLLNVNRGDIAQHQVSQEVRIASPADGAVSWIAGAFYFRQAILNQSDRLGSISEVADFFGLRGATTQRLTVDTESAALFGDATWRLSDRLRLLGGARLTRETMDTDFDRRTPPTAAFPIAADYAATGSRSDQAWSWRAGAQYDLSSDTMAYATVSRGFKAGGFNVILDMQALRPIEPEIPTSVEAGVKSALLDRRLLVNLAAFHTEFAGYQAQTLVTTPTFIGFDLQNVGKVRTRGVEAEAVYRPIQALTLALAGAYVDARYADFKGAACHSNQAVVGTGCVMVAPGVYTQDLSGARLPEPQWTANGSARYERPLGPGRTGFGQVGVAWRGEALTSQAQDPDTRQAAYALVDASAGVTFANGARLSLWGRNLFDTNYAELIFDTPFDSGTPTTRSGKSQFTPIGASRVLGVALDYRY